MVIESGLSLSSVVNWDLGKTLNAVLAEHLEKVAKRLNLLEKRVAGK
jgi:hypothetical protein